MLVALITNHRGNGFFIFRPGEGWEYVMTLTLAGFAIAMLGAGEWSLDHALEIFDPPGLDGLLIAVGRGRAGRPPSSPRRGALPRRPRPPSVRMLLAAITCEKDDLAGNLGSASWTCCAPRRHRTARWRCSRR